MNGSHTRTKRMNAALRFIYIYIYTPNSAPSLYPTTAKGIVSRLSSPADTGLVRDSNPDGCSSAPIPGLPPRATTSRRLRIWFSATAVDEAPSEEAPRLVRHHSDEAWPRLPSAIDPVAVSQGQTAAARKAMAIARERGRHRRRDQWPSPKEGPRHGGGEDPEARRAVEAGGVSARGCPTGLGRLDFLPDETARAGPGRPAEEVRVLRSEAGVRRAGVRCLPLAELTPLAEFLLKEVWCGEEIRKWDCDGQLPCS
ncbi:hypothetical protein OPV22_032119 [Ensete ventricosum]|uniref:Uncharacterized protein n=1 Tax=Ensete ventricosum TaxID=4639 RepID=A0AAV8PQP0_ENSVE|nr:hypothetical protein OPV22_032119 [Ensete ventricosum]